MHRKKNTIFLVILAATTMIVVFSIIKNFRRNNCIHQNERNLIKIGQAFKSYIKKHNRLPSSAYDDELGWTNVLIKEGFVKDPRVFLSPELKLLRNKDEFIENNLSYVYNRGFEIDGKDENVEGLNYDNITSPRHTILLTECFWAGNYEQATDSDNQITSVKDARQISEIANKMLKYKAGLGYLVLFADGHIERFKAGISISDKRLMYVKELANRHKDVVLCKNVIDATPIELTETYKSGEMVWIFIEWNERNFNKVSFEVYSQNGVLMAKQNMVNRNDLACWAFFSEDSKWRMGEYTAKIYVNGGLQAEKVFNVVK